MKCRCGESMIEIELAPDHWWCSNCGSLTWATSVYVETSGAGSRHRMYDEDSINTLHPATFKITG